ncbi:hypothetical protein E4634_00085 [Mangrovimicrobium sediminis]|uniref:Uncharacterized protein n=1 Tax=Mangrovimicrobium sediminis TaxID=2562682 RepID=A0A4Z0M8Y4_9GAMM|nr:hypothetical protein [Haliea sp. SAOS-164]TGD75991.1 hypothetical protein E4634_00085 [Haliea sp. SAOS-164]
MKAQNSSYDLAQTKRIFETKRKLTANKKLNSGWILVGVSLKEPGFMYTLALPGGDLPWDSRVSPDKVTEDDLAWLN